MKEADLQATCWRFFVPVVKHYRLSGLSIFEAWRAAERKPARALDVYRTLARSLGLAPVAPWSGLDVPIDRSFLGGSA